MSDIIYVSNIGPHMSNIAMPALHSMSNTSRNHEISRYLAAAVLVSVPVPLKITKWYWYRYRYRSKFQNWYWYRPGTGQKFGTVIHWPTVPIIYSQLLIAQSSKYIPTATESPQYYLYTES